MPTQTLKDNQPSPSKHQNLFTIVVEHTDDVSRMSATVRDLLVALPAVTRVGIFFPNHEGQLVLNDGSGTHRPVMP